MLHNGILLQKKSYRTKTSEKRLYKNRDKYNSGNALTIQQGRFLRFLSTYVPYPPKTAAHFIPFVETFGHSPDHRSPHLARIVFSVQSLLFLNMYVHKFLSGTLTSALLLALLAGCQPTGRQQQPPAVALADVQAGKEVLQLRERLQQAGQQGVLFGHQDDTVYGMQWWGQAGGSDTFSACGDYPAVYGWDLGHLGDSLNIDGVPFGRIRAEILLAHGRGGMNTLSWHLRHPKTGQGCWDTTPVVAELLPGGPLHHLLKAELDKVAAFVLSLRTPAGEPVPLVFRPWHEHTGSWFWWGAEHCTPEQYKALWRFTVQYLTQTKGVHQLLFAYSPDNFRDSAHYLERYPGDAYVDVLGLDDYHNAKPDRQPEGLQALKRELGELRAMAEMRGKLAALTETGALRIPQADWYTHVLLEALKAEPVCWVLVWRNANQAREGKLEYCVPPAGHAALPDFRAFHAHPLTLFQKEFATMGAEQALLK